MTCRSVPEAELRLDIPFDSRQDGRFKCQTTNMRKTVNCYSKVTTKIITVLVTLGLLAVIGCSQEKADGTFLIVELENSENVKQYSVFNPYVRSVEECNSNANTAISQILASVPRVVPEDSKVKSWRCSLTPPESGG
jgi:hypothetical protein